MPSSDDVLAVLRGVVDPELGVNVVDLGMVTSIDLDPQGRVEIGLALTVAQCPMRSYLEGETSRKVASLPGVSDVRVKTTAMTREQRANLMSGARLRARENAHRTKVHPTTRVVAISSGKGGVGKSTVAVNLAVALARSGFEVGLLDADIWGFSVPRMIGSEERLAADDETKLIIPAEAQGIKVVSTGLIIESEETALMWRGLMLSKALEQFLNQVEWGMLDYLVIDMPPGTGDIQMALARLLPQAEMVVVTTPQLAAQKVAVRVADMARRSHMPIIGVIENMSTFVCEHGRQYPIFGSGGGADLSATLSVPLLGQIPLDPAVVIGGDEGAPVTSARPEAAAAQEFRRAADRLVELLPPVDDENCTGRIAKLLEQLAVSEAVAGPVG
ncbi:MAG TPA: Mrp/NBP35 family ATP-binding protein [Acidimicrobiia bacterium]|jgi:ATP-binding protein involved in chromosome partitioning|nr:Mrp/NBP35 family ATP-binding protein [Acidimicrobiia bacterium]